jgi:biotin carboxylase
MTDVSERWLLSLPAGPEQLAPLLAAKQLGWKVLAVDGNAAAPGAAHADAFVQVDLRDVNAVRTVVRRWPIQAIIPAPVGRLLTTVGALNDHFGWRGCTEHAARLLVDKESFHRHAASLGLRRPDQESVRSSEELADCLSRATVARVIKPRHGAGSRHVTVLRHAGELPEVLSNYASFDFKADSLLVESFVEGEELGVDFVLVDGAYRRVLARAKRLTPLPDRVVLDYTAPAPVSSEEDAALDQELALLTGSLGLRDAVFHADVVLGADGPVVLEASARPVGLLMSERMLPAVFDSPFLGALIQLVTSGEFPFPDAPVHAAALSFLPLPAGRVTAIDRRALDPRVELAAREGGVLPPLKDVASVLARGYVLTAAPNLEAASDLAERLTHAALAAVTVSTMKDPNGP